jgi:photosystem I subunit 8
MPGAVVKTVCNEKDILTPESEYAYRHCCVVELGETPMAAAFLPSILVPLVGIVMPAAAMAFLFLYIEREDAV